MSTRPKWLIANEPEALRELMDYVASPIASSAPRPDQDAQKNEAPEGAPSQKSARSAQAE